MYFFSIFSGFVFFSTFPYVRVFCFVVRYARVGGRVLVRRGALGAVCASEALRGHVSVPAR